MQSPGPSFGGLGFYYLLVIRLSIILPSFKQRRLEPETATLSS